MDEHHADNNFFDNQLNSDHSMRGLIGLRNLGNTCYMNAAIQALSNCPPLREYFRTVPLNAREESSSSSSSNDSGHSSSLSTSTLKPVSNVFSDLLKKLWSDSQTHLYVAPTLLLWRVREKWPQFRGYNQQDSQEFIRCLLDLLHQELRRPVRKWENDLLMESDSLSPSVNETCSSVSSSHASSREDLDNDQFETADSGLSSDADDSPKPKKYVDGVIPNTSRQEESGSSDHMKIVGHRSIITEVFDGELVSSVKCQTCQHISYTRESFQDISLSIPTIEQLEYMRDAVELEQASNETAEEACEAFTGSTDQTLLNGSEGTVSTTSPSYLSWFYSIASRWFFQPLGNFFASYYRYMFTGAISLENCLKAFFSADLLHGEDMYSCEKCGKLRNGVKQCQLTRLPEILCIHLKRFRHDNMYSGKINTKVTFPLYDLDVRPFIREATLQKDDQIASEYDLVAVVSHRGGGLDYGHYIAYCRNDLDMNWYEYDDSIVTRVNALEVMSKEAYVLFYQRRSRPEMERIKIEGTEMIRAGLQNEHQPIPSARQEPLERMNLISRDYLQKFFTFSDPGQINNYEFLCHHGNLAPSLAGSTPGGYVLISSTVWDYLQQAMGGGPECKGDLTDCVKCKQALTALIQRKLTEFKGFTKADMKTKYCDFLPPHVISKHWLEKWKNFVMQIDAEPPPPINNEALVRRFKDGSTRLRIGCKCLKITREAWLYLHQIYGGGPEAFSVPLNQPTPEEVSEMLSRAEDAIQAYYESKSMSRNEELSASQGTVVAPTASTTPPETSISADAQSDEEMEDLTELGNSAKNAISKETDSEV